MSGQATCSYFFFAGMMRPNIAQVRLQVIKHFSNVVRSKNCLIDGTTTLLME